MKGRTTADDGAEQSEKETQVVEGATDAVDADLLDRFVEAEGVVHTVVREREVGAAVAVLTTATELYSDPSLSEFRGVAVPDEVLALASEEARVEVEEVRTDDSGFVVTFEVDEVLADGGVAESTLAALTDDERERLASVVDGVRQEVEEVAGDDVSVGSLASLGFVADRLGGRE